MNGFLARLCDELFQGYSPEELKYVEVILPHSRAVLYLNDEIGKRLTRPEWSPHVTTFSDRITASVSSERQVPDKNTLILELWLVYKTIFSEEKAERFWAWGEALTEDFNEIDHQLADPAKLFRFTYDWLKLENDPVELIELSVPESEFWRNFVKGKSEMRDKFLILWEKMPELYHAFRSRLNEKGMAYSGMIFRELSENSEPFLSQLQNQKNNGKVKTVIIAGLHHLSAAETKVLELIKNFWKENSRIIVDSDPYYTENKIRQAGHFFRIFRRTFPEAFPQPPISRLASESKYFHLVSCPSAISQTKALAPLLEEHLQRYPGEESQTAIVVADESLLFSVLAALPESVKDFNVTLGFPIILSPYQSLTEELLKLRFTQKKESGVVHYYYKSVVSLSEHPYLPELRPIGKYVKEHKIIFFNREHLQKCFGEKPIPVSAEMIFREAETISDFNLYLYHIIAYVTESLQLTGTLFAPELEITYLYLTNLLRLQDLIETYDLNKETGIGTWLKLFRQILRASRLSFTGEPLTGIQILSWEETQALDFKHVFILSANEKALPPKPVDRSFIPFSIRKAYGLRSGSDRSARSAYLYYRLLQGAEKITALYSTSESGKNSSERSRFLMQLLYQWRDENPNLTVKETTVSAGNDIDIEAFPEVPKTETVLKAVENFLREKKISPKVLITYVKCSLRFYFDYVLRLKSPEDLSEEVSETDLGNLLHRSTEILLNRYLNVPLSEEIFSQIYKRIPESVKEAYQEYFSGTQPPEKGRAFYTAHILEELLKAFTDTDKSAFDEGETIKILSLEKEWESKFEISDKKITVTLTGRTDRTDERKDGYLIADYKTGKVSEKLHLKEDFFLVSESAALPDLLKDTEEKLMQALIYVYLVHLTENKSDSVIRSAIYRAKSTDKELIYFTHGDDKKSFSGWTSEEINKITIGLDKIFHSMLNPQTTFKQTSDIKACRYCPHISICKREEEEE